MRKLISLISLMGLSAVSLVAQTNPIVFVTQTPHPEDFVTIGSTFGNHEATMRSVLRGGGLWIRYPDGSLKELTAAGGYGESDVHQGEDAIAVRDPAVHWSGNKVLFSMVVGAPPRYQRPAYRWQLYEVTNLGQSETPVITKVPNQPAGFNNISPVYGTNGRIIFTSDRPRDEAGSAHLYPQLDEYEEQSTVSGLWSMDPATGDLFIMEHAPSGSFTPFIDSYGRVIFTRWDHLQRDQQADADAESGTAGGTYGTFNYSDESATAQKFFGVRDESFPEPGRDRDDLLDGTNQEGLRFNLFFPWMIEEDGTGMETLNHIGRHELHDFFNRNFNDDPAVTDFVAPAGRVNQNSIESLFHIAEDPTSAGLYIGVDAPEFATHSSGMIVSLTGAPTVNPDDMVVTYLTHPDTGNTSDSPAATHSGLYRDPLPTSDGLLIASHTSETREDDNVGATGTIESLYDYRIKTLTKNQDGYYVPGSHLTSGITRSITWWSPDDLVSYNGEMWELQAVELVARTIPVRSAHELPAIETQMIADSGESLENLKAYLRSQKLAMVVMRDLTTRDDADKQQPYRLRVEGDTSTPPGAGTDKVYDIKYLQFFQGDQVRGVGLVTPESTPGPGRRVLARPMHEGSVLNQAGSSAPVGAVEIEPDGSAVAIVPARRALSWQITDGGGDPVVRERFWLSFQPGEVRSCTSCHGVNKIDQAGASPPLNTPQALGKILQAWVDTPPAKASLSQNETPEGGVTITIKGYQGQTVQLQRSQNLSQWFDEELITLTEDVYYHQIPASAMTAGRYFYRVSRPVVEASE